MALAVKVENLEKKFGRTKAVDKLDFEVGQGEIFGLLGPNGAGKTTTIRIMLNLIEEFQGNVQIFGERFSEKMKDLIGYLPEERGLYKNLTALGVVKYLAVLKGMECREAEKRALKLMRGMDLLEFKDKKIYKLSKGTQQKMQIISSLIHNPRLLVLDEPFSGLDPLSVKFIIKAIKNEKKRGKTIILSTHDMHIAEQVCERVIVINKGRRALYGKIKEVKERYSDHGVLIEFKGEIPKIQGVKKVIMKGKNSAELLLEIQAKPDEILKQLVTKGLKISKFEEVEPSLESIFLFVVEAEQWVKC